MFAEEEWNDDADAKALTKAMIRGTPFSKGASVTPNACSRKRSLLRTLQSLSAVPDWSQDTVHKHSDDSDEEGAPPPVKRKKKRNRKQRRTAASGEDGAGLESGQEEVKKQPGSKLSKGKNRKDSRVEARSKVGTEKNAVKGSERMDLQPKAEQSEEVERQLSRQQWRNKMKNKRKCKNKYRQSTGQTQSGPKAGISQQQAAGMEPGSAPLTHSQTGKIKSRSRGKGEVHEEEKPAAMGKTDEMALSEGQSNGEVGRVKGHPGTGDKPLSRETEEMDSKRKRESWQQKMRADKLRKMLQSVHVENSGGAEQVETQDSRREEEDGKQKAETRSAEGAASDRSAALKARMEQRLEAARFRYINEQLYTSSSGEARRMFLQDPHAFDVYHRGFTAQVQRWPTNPVDSIIAYIKNRPASQVVADFGCGDCKIARSVKNKVHSFDLAPVCDLVTVCDMAKVPLPKASVHIAVFCLSLMGTNLLDFLVEANRVLVMGGVLKIAEVASRFENVRSFVGALSGLGFKLASKDTENSHFYSFEFVKTGDVLEKTRKKGLELKPCVYKKR